MLRPVPSNGWHVLKEMLVCRDFWLLLCWIVLAVCGLAWVIWQAVHQYDAFLRLKPLIYAEGIGNRSLLVVIFVSPLTLAFVLAALGCIAVYQALAC